MDEEIIQQETITVDTDVVEICPKTDMDRLEIVLTNSGGGAQNITLGFDRTAVDKAGAYLPPFGTYNSPEKAVFQGRITAVSSAAGATLSVFIRTKPKRR